MIRNEYEVHGNTAHVIITSKGERYTVKIDVEDLPRVSTCNWCISSRYHKDGRFLYAGNTKLNKDMHRVIMDAPKGMEVDHINQDTLDNRKENLRIVTSAENKQNRNRLPTNNTSGVRGVKWDKKRNKWKAGFESNKKFIFVGYFDDLEVARQQMIIFRSTFSEYSSESEMGLKIDIDLNDRIRSDNTSGVKGINWDKRRNYWRVRVKEKEIFTSPDFEEAKSFLESYKKEMLNHATSFNERDI